MQTMKVVCVLLLFFSAARSGCSSAEYSAADIGGATPCHDPRPQLCTTDYTPVCGKLNDTTLKTYANGCTACSDTAVSSFNLGECEE